MIVGVPKEIKDNEYRVALTPGGAEMLAQAGCLLIADQLAGKTPYLTGIKNARFRRKVKPGDTLSIRCEGQAKKPPFMFIKAEGSVAGEPAVSGEFSFVIEGGEG